jgi:CheY-like chemotaxis protein
MKEKKILIIDDDPRNIFALSAVLRAKGYTPISAPSATDGIAMLDHHQEIGVVLMDIMMPDMDGYEAIARIRQMKGLEELPVIAVTAQAMVGDREKCIEAGATDYVSKPIDLDRLLSILKNL